MKFYKRFPGDIQIKTGHLSPAEFGCYDRLLDHYYATEVPLPIENERCYSIARTRTPADCRAVDKVLAEFFEATPEGWVQRRAEEVIAEALPRIEAARTNGRRGGRPKSNPPQTEPKPTGLLDETQGRTETADLAKASHKPEPDSSASQKNPPTPRKSRGAFDPKTIELPAWLDRAVWTRWCVDRAQRRKPITKAGAEGQIARLDKLRADGHSPTAVIEHCITNGYQGLFPPPRDAQPNDTAQAEHQRSAETLAQMEADRQASQTPEAKAAAAQAMQRINAVIKRVA